MCTVSIAKEDDAYIVAMNRDESHARSDATNLCADNPFFAYPVDPQAGGTWISTSTLGVTLVLLNQYPAQFVPENKNYLSRGTIIPSLLKATSALEAIGQAQTLDPQDFLPFLLVAVDFASINFLLRSDGKKFTFELSREKKLLLSSSAWNDSAVGEWRLAQFENNFSLRDSVTIKDLVTFHQLKHPADDAFSVDMQRSDARTVSLTTVEANSRCTRLRYHFGGARAVATSERVLSTLDARRGESYGPSAQN